MIEKKYRFILSVIMSVAVLILGRVFYLQTFDRGFLVEKSTKQRSLPIPIQANRGVIKSSDGNILATSVPVFVVYSDSRYIKDEDKAQVAKTIADFFNLDSEDVLKTMNKGYYAELVKGVSKTQIDEFVKIKPKGINYYKTSSRVYPNNEIFGNVLGFIGKDNNGLAGIESSLDKYLKGTDGSNNSQKDKHGNQIEYDSKDILPSINGKDVTLTIDYNLQYQMYKSLKNQVDNLQARKGIAISINPNNGNILGIAEYPSYDPNNYKDASQELYKSSAVSMAYEPGSTFKPITVAIAESLNLIDDKNDRFLDDNAFYVDGFTIHSWNHKGFGYQTVTEVLENSSNAGAARIGLKIPTDTFQLYLDKLGFGHKTGIEISGEGNSIMQSNARFQSKIARATTSFGQGIAVTPIQLINAWCPIVNGGYKIQPHMLKNVIDENGTVTYSDDDLNKQGEQIFPTTASDSVKKMLQSVVDNGTGKVVRIPGYSVGGKTGTAQIAENGVYVKGRNIVSFVGFAPVENPQILTLVIIDSPQDSNSVGGGTMCGPVAKDILEYALQEYGIKPTITKDTSNKDKDKDKDDSKKEDEPTELNVNTEDYRKRPKSYVDTHKPSIPYEFKGEGDIITDQNYVSENGNTKIVFNLDTMVKDDYIIMPNLIGMSADEFISLFGDYSNNIVINGTKNQPITMQDISSGQHIDSKNQKITLWTN